MICLRVTIFQSGQRTIVLGMLVICVDVISIRLTDNTHFQPVFYDKSNGNIIDKQFAQNYMLQICHFDCFRYLTREINQIRILDWVNTKTLCYWILDVSSFVLL